MRSIKFVVLVFAASIGLFPSLAQSEEPVYVLRDDALIALDVSSQPEIVTALQPETSAMTDDLNDEHRFVMMAQLIEPDQTVYYLQHEGQVSAREPFPTRTYIAGIDTRTGARQIVYEQANILRFNLSPDGRYIAISYFEGAYYNSRIRMCVYDLQIQNECWTLPFWIVDQQARWIDSDEFLLIKSGNLRLIDATNRTDRQIFNPEPITWNLQGFTPITGARFVVMTTDRVSLSETPRYRMFIVDIDNGSVVHSFDGEQNYMVFTSVSPNGQYLLYESRTSAILELTTGNVLHRFERIINAYWRDGSTLVLQGQLTDDAPFQIATFDVITGAITVLATGDDAGGILLAS
jgi:hypothetical protein